MIRKIYRENSCMACGEYNVTESVDVEYLDKDCIPDQSNCDFSNYRNYDVRGGVLLEKRPLTTSTSGLLLAAICDHCLAANGGFERVIEFMKRKGWVKW